MADTDPVKPPKPQGMPINLVVAVSFGLFVPPRILGAAKYGGLNVHPSMLPEYEDFFDVFRLYSADLASFYGPAPLHHTLILDWPWAGITVQTMHSKYFDQGTKLLQHPDPGIKHECRSVEELSRFLARRGADMLVDCLRNHLYLYGSVIAAPEARQEPPWIQERHAPKITTADRFINWEKWSGHEIMRKHQVIGPLWSLGQIDEESQTTRRIIWSTGFEATLHEPDAKFLIGRPMVTGYLSPSPDVWVKACGGQILRIDQITIEGGQQAEPLMAAIRANMNHLETRHDNVPLFRGSILSKLPKP